MGQLDDIRAKLTRLEAAAAIQAAAQAEIAEDVTELQAAIANLPQPESLTPAEMAQFEAVTAMVEDLAAKAKKLGDDTVAPGGQIPPPPPPDEV